MGFAPPTCQNPYHINLLMQLRALAETTAQCALLVQVASCLACRPSFIYLLCMPLTAGTHSVFSWDTSVMVTSSSHTGICQTSALS